MRSRSFMLVALVLATVLVLAGCVALPALPLPTVTPRAPRPTAVGVEPTVGAPSPASPVPTEVLPAPTMPPAAETVAGPTPTQVVPSGPATVPDTCVADAGQQVVSRAEDGYCLAFPDKFKIMPNEQGALSIVGPALDQSAEPVMATLTVAAAAAPGDLDATIKQSMAEFADFKEWTINRLDVELGGVPAAMFEPVPGRLSSRNLIAVQGGKMYTLAFWPVDIEAALNDVNELYNAVISSWQFIPAAPAVSISGAVVWGEQAVPGAGVELRTPDWRTNPNSIVATTSADEQGLYEFKAPLSGRYEIVPAFPADANDASPQGGIPVIVAPGGAVKDLNVYLSKQVMLVSPADGAEVGTAPLLTWKPVEGAALYRVIVNDPATLEGYFGADVAATSVTVDPPLKAGVTYTWVVNALTQGQGLLGVGEGKFTVK